MIQPAVLYTIASITEINLIRPLWEQLNDHHHANARAFRDVYSAWGFDDRKAFFEGLATSGQFRIGSGVGPACRVLRQLVLTTP